MGADPSALALLLYTHSHGNGFVPPTACTQLQCPPPPQGASLPSIIVCWALCVLGTCRCRLSGPQPQNAEVLRSGHCVCPRHTDFGLSLASVAAPTPAACALPVTYGVRPVPVPCIALAPATSSPPSVASPPQLRYHLVLTAVSPHLARVPRLGPFQGPPP